MSAQTISQLECLRFTCILVNRMTISTLKANQKDVRIPVRQKPPVSSFRVPNLHSRTMSDGVREGREGTELVDGTYGGVMPTILSSIHVYT